MCGADVHVCAGLHISADVDIGRSLNAVVASGLIRPANCDLTLFLLVHEDVHQPQKLL